MKTTKTYLINMFPTSQTPWIIWEFVEEVPAEYYFPTREELKQKKHIYKQLLPTQEEVEELTNALKTFRLVIEKLPRCEKLILPRYILVDYNLRRKEVMRIVSVKAKTLEPGMWSSDGSKYWTNLIPFRAFIALKSFNHLRKLLGL